MTIKEIVLENNAGGINYWLAIAKKHNLNAEQEKILLDCAEYFNKIEINQAADFIKTINI